ncbi:MAG: hypothetical protein ACOCVN_00050, partial [bacterium]
MIKFRFIIIVACFIFSSNSCDKEILADDELTLEKELYTGEQLRIDGYYYLKDKNNTLISTYFFYENGILLYGGGRPYPEGLSEIENKIFTSKQWIDKIGSQKLSWGVFQIDNNKIYFEKWYPSSGGPTPAYIRSGEILNDTTFVITK